MAKPLAILILFAFSLGAAVVKDGGIAYSNAYGYAHLEYDIPNTPTTIFHIASILKQFTTFSILLLEAGRKLSLDDEIQQYIPELPYFNYLPGHTEAYGAQCQRVAGPVEPAGDAEHPVL